MKRFFYLIIILSFIVMTHSPPAAQIFGTYSQFNNGYFGQDSLFSSSYSNILIDYPSIYSYPTSSIIPNRSQNAFSTWYNHSPIYSYGPEFPMVLSAGQTGLASYYVIDPDFESFYTYSSIGSTGRGIDGSPVWSFSTNFPGWYSVDSAFYDIRGGFSVMRSPVYVKPWWSF